MDLEMRVSELENLVHSLISKIGNDKFYSNADIQGIRQTSGEQGKVIEGHSESIDQNTADIDFIAMETGVEL